MENVVMADLRNLPAPAEQPVAARQQRLFVVMNPAAGRADPALLAQILARHCTGADQCFAIHELEPEHDLKQLLATALAEGYNCIVAAGGDGTISAVANALLDHDVPLAILPIGTANVLARELNIPLELNAACKLILGRHALRRLDAMECADRLAILQIGIGLGSLMIRDTSTRAKKLLGRAAYLGTGLTRLVGYEPRVFTVHVDGKRYRRHALHVVIANGGVMGQPPFRWGPDIDPSDGRIDVAMLQSRNLADLLVLAWYMLRGRHRRSRRAYYYQAHETISVAASKPLPIQADGEIIGETPLEVRVRRSVLPVIVPCMEPEP